MSGYFPGSRFAEELDDAFREPSRLVVVASSQLVPSVHEHADELAYKAGVPWLSITMEHPVIRIGPLVNPGEGPCFRCYMSRRRQHDRRWSSSRILHDAYDRGESPGPGGFLPQHPRIAAGAAACLLGEHGATGQVITMSLLRLDLAAHVVTACHGCDRCAPPAVLPGLADLLSQEVGASAH
nr:TOMM precursor leader peptide-binding protein [Nonomuraea sp. K271]